MNRPRLDSSGASSAEDFAALLGLPAQIEHLQEALTHPSYSNEQRPESSSMRSGPRTQPIPGSIPPPPRRADNQRLEFLGDAVLGLCVGELLMDRFPTAREGELSLLRSQLVNTAALASWARSVDLGSALRLGRGADSAGERDRDNVLADAVEALIGAVYLDCGLDLARKLSAKIVDDPLAHMVSGDRLVRDAKSELQERVQAEGRSSPRYRVTGVEGPDHRRRFVVVVEVDGEPIAEGRGSSKKSAEQAAARAALEARGVPRSTFPGPTSGPPSSFPESGESS